MHRKCPVLALLLVLSLLSMACLDTGGKGDVHAEQGILLMDSGNLQGALTELETALSKGVKNYSEAEIYTIMGNIYNEQDDMDKAISSHRKALELDPNMHNAWVNLGICYRLTEDYKEAEKCYLKALALDPNYPELHASLGALYIYQDKYTEAVASLEKAIALDATLPVSHSNLALALAYVGEFDRADQELQEAVRLGYENGSTLQEMIDELRAGAPNPLG